MATQLYFTKPPTQIDWIYCGPSSMTGLTAQRKIEESLQEAEQKIKGEYEKLLQSEKASYSQYQNLVLGKLQERYEDWVNERIALLPEYVTTVVQHLLPHIELKKETVETLVHLLLKDNNEEQQKLTLFLSEKDFRWAKDFEAKLKSQYPLLTFEVDPNLSSGDCRLKTTWGEIDGRMITRLQEVKTLLSY